jgi:hypothetical protein
MTRTFRVAVPGGHACEVELTPEATGFAYEVWRRAGAGRRALVCQGWTAGTLAEGLDEARQHAGETLRRTLCG